MSAFESNVNHYLEEFFGASLLTIEEPTPPLPIQLKRKLHVRVVKLNGLYFYVVETPDDKLFQKNNIILFEKVLDRLTHYPVLFIAKGLNQRAIIELTRRKIAHIVPYERAYIPQLVLHQDSPPKKRAFSFTDDMLGILPSNIVARYLDGSLPRTFSTSDISIDVSRASISRSIKELENAGLISRSMHGRKSEIRFKFRREDIWDSKEDLIAPLASEIQTVPKDLLGNKSILSGESALSMYTLLSEPNKPCYAIYLQNQDRVSYAITTSTIKALTSVYFQESHKSWADEEEVEIQVFPYSPVVKEIRGRTVISEVMLALSGYKRGEPRIQTSFGELEEKILNKLKTLDAIDFE
ncbi:hypothetical protein ACVD2U_004135 [Vibrio parahaemolyticus]|nr:hypothetical protein [Vibrio parahaemolyticus]EJG1828818.1 hypothetical protein [Vibrio parahaemolyticus]ELC9531745.1 hypothetical protein [Vibrio parahaemolyticus]